MRQTLEQFIDASPTAFHAVEVIKQELIAEGFEELVEYEVWNLQENKKYFVIRNGSSLFAFTTPTTFKSIQLCTSHLDSPTFKIKETKAMIDQSLIRLDVERYGGMILRSWFDRPLAMAGRVVVENNGLQTVLFDDKKDSMMIPSAPIHLQRDVNEGTKINVQKEMLPIIGQGEDFNLKNYIKDHCQIEGEILSIDAYLYNRQPAMQWGMNKEFFSAPRIDNLECTYAIVKALLTSSNDNVINMALLFDNEEVGSTTKQGADSSFLTDVLARIQDSFSITQQEMLCMIASGFMISADNAHGMHPGYKELYNPSGAPIVNKGIVIKHNANQKYTTDAVSSAIFRKLCTSCGVSYQDFYNHSNAMGGSTLGNIANSHVSLNTIDIGLAQWAMHSSFETAGNKDLEDLTFVLKAFYNSTIHIEKNIIF